MLPRLQQAIWVCMLPRFTRVCTLSVTVSIKVRREPVEIADKMVRYGVARSRSHAFND